MKKLRKYHKYPSLVIGLFLILFSVSGIIMNHRGFFSPADVSRALMPPVYRYSNWNLAAVKGNIAVANGQQLIYGNTGIWSTDTSFSRFSGLNEGFGRGIDRRKVFTLTETSDRQLFAGTLFGLWKFDEKGQQWRKIALPEKNPRVVKVHQYNDRLLVMTRDHLYTLSLKHLNQVRSWPLKVPEGSDGKVSLFRTLWVLHSGEMLGITGKLLVDLVGIVMIFICLSGFYYTLLPKFARKTSLKLRLKLQKINRTSIRWHNLTGGYGILILTITVVSGMFLRPPLLIPIATSRVAPVPGTILGHNNHWHDKLRDFTIDSANNRLLFSTSEGFYETGLDQSGFCRSLKVQPPVSVMGITVFEPYGSDRFLVGSFSGLYLWNPEEGSITDAVTGSRVFAREGGNPFGATAVSGLIIGSHGPEAYLDYDGGWIPLKTGAKVPAMPGEIKNSPVSLWNVALEVHTGRIFSVILGDFYILYVPLMGLTTILILITGFMMWYRSLKKKKNRTNRLCHENNQTEPGAESTV